MVTYAREAEVGRDEEETMAQHMNHQISTADKIYDVGKKLHITSNFRLTLRKIVGDGDDDPSTGNDAHRCEEIDACDEPSQLDDPSTEIVGFDVPSEETELDYQNLGCSSSNQNKVKFGPSSSTKIFKRVHQVAEQKYSPKQAGKIFTAYDIRLLKKACGDWMRSVRAANAPTKKQDLATQLKSPSGEELLEKFSFLQIYTRVRFMIKGTYQF